MWWPRSVCWIWPLPFSLNFHAQYYARVPRYHSKCTLLNWHWALDSRWIAAGEGQRIMCLNMPSIMAVDVGQTWEGQGSTYNCLQWHFAMHVLLGQREAIWAQGRTEGGDGINELCRQLKWRFQHLSGHIFFQCPCGMMFNEMCEASWSATATISRFPTVRVVESWKGTEKGNET